MKKGSVVLGADEEEGKSESKVMNHIFGRLQHPINVKFLFAFSNFWGVERASAKKIMC